jgi:hypothetical protein
MKKVITLEFHIEQDIAPEAFCALVGVACADCAVVRPGDVVRSAVDGFGIEVQPIPDFDWKAFDEQLDALFVKDCDTYMAGAIALFGNVAVMDNPKVLRTKTKLVFLRAFRVRGRAWVQSTFEFADKMANVLQDRGLWKEISDEANKRILAEDEADAT